MDYTPIAHDNRGTLASPFGRVYIARSKKGEAAGSFGYGAHRDDPRPLAVWPTHDTPDNCSTQTRFNVEAYLKQHFPHLAENLPRVSVAVAPELRGTPWPGPKSEMVDAILAAVTEEY